MLDHRLAAPGARVVYASSQGPGCKAGENLTGYLPFEVPATPYLERDRTNWLVLRVENGVRYDWLPGTTTVEWVQYGGLLEPVELFTTAPVHIARRLQASHRAFQGHRTSSRRIG